MVFALVKSTSWGWASANTLGTLAASFVLIGLFVFIERRTQSALVPLSIFGNRSLSVSNVVSLALGASIFSMFYFLSLYMQEVLGYSALKTGVGYLAIAGSIIVAAGAAQALVAKLGVRLVMTIGMALAAGGLIFFAQISPHGSYLGTLLPGFILAGVGLGLSFVPVTIGAMSGVEPHEAGVASGLITTTQQIGGALGVAVLSTIAVSATTRFIGAHGHAPAELTNALNHGFSIAFWFGAVFAAIGCGVSFFGMSGTPLAGALPSESVTEPGPIEVEPVR
jgi:predicted MFS family arabinose efflux permease